MGSAAQPSSSLSPGVWFWRLHGKTGDTVGQASSATWEFVVTRDAAAAGPSNTSWGSNGDVNGDGFSDLAILVEDASMQRGLALYAGGGEGITTTGTVVSTPGVKSLAPAGDVNGDGFADVLYQGMGPAGALTACVLLGSDSGLSTTPRCAPPPEAIDDNFGLFLGGLGDTDLDGYADVFVSQSHFSGPLNFPTFILVWRGGSTGLDPTSTRFEAPSGMALTGPSAVGDLDGDGFADLAANQWNAPSGMVAGTAWVAWGNSAGLSSDRTTTIANPPSFENVNATFLAGSDLTGDGRSDLQISAYQMGTLCPGIISLSAARVQNTTVPETDCSSTIQGGQPIGSVDGDGFGEVVRVDSTTHHLLVVSGTNFGPAGTLLDIAPPTTGNWTYARAIGRISNVASLGFVVPVVPSTGPFTEFDLFTATAGVVSSSPTARLLAPMGYVFPRNLPFVYGVAATAFGVM